MVCEKGQAPGFPATATIVTTGEEGSTPAYSVHSGA